MKKIIKIILLILALIVLLVLLDSFQAKIFNNSPILHVRQYYEENNEIEYVDRGILVRHYKFNSGIQDTLFNWENTTY